MVLLTMTPFLVEVLNKRHTPTRSQECETSTSDETPNEKAPASEPSLDEPEVGKPILHTQILEIWRELQAQSESHSLEQLLRGADIYIPPPPPKPEPSPEYKALMARLRRQEETRSYERMINRRPPNETFQDRFPYAAAAFAEVNKPISAEDLGDDDTDFNEVHRQVTLIINFLVSIAGVAATLWIAARWWSVSSRLFLTLGGSILVAIAEVVVYSGYMWRMEEGKKKDKKAKEVKEVMESWTVGREEDKEVVVIEEEEDVPEGMRKRKHDQPVKT